MGWLHDRMMECIRFGFTDILREEGYQTKRERRWNYVGEGYVRNVAILGRSNIWEFQVALSVSFPALTSVFQQMGVRMGIQMSSGYPVFARGAAYTPWPAQVRLGDLRPDHPNGFWMITPDTRLPSLCNEIIDTWERYGKPWMESLRDLESLHHVLRQHHEVAVSTHGNRYPGQYLIEMVATAIALRDFDQARDEINEYLLGDRPAAGIERMQVLQAMVDEAELE